MRPGEQTSNDEGRIRVLMLVNWRVQYAKEKVPAGIQPPDFCLEGKPYWFFRYMDPRFSVDVVDISAPSLIGKVEKKARFYLWQTLRVLPRLNQYDLVVSHGMQSGIVLALWRRIFGKGRYCHIVFDIGAFNSGRRSGKALKLMQFASKSLDGVIYHTEVQKDYYKNCHPWLLEKSRFILFGTDADFFGEDMRKKAAGYRETERLEEETAETSRQYILSFGKIKRDWNTLLKAYDYSEQRLPIKIVGDTTIHSENSQVEILAAVSLSDLKELIRKAAFCVVPLKSMPYSYGQMTLLQQMAMGKAVIAADVPSLASYHGGDGVLWYDPENALDLAEKMDFLAAYPEHCEQLGEKAAELIRTTYNEKNMADAIQSFFLDILASR